MKNQDILVFSGIFVSIFFTSIIGDYLVMDIPVLSMILDAVSSIIPSIKILELNSDFPLLTRRYLSLMWLLIPVFVFVILKTKRGIIINEDFYARLPWRYLFLVILFLMIFFIMLVYFISHDLLAGAPRDKSSELVFMRKIAYTINSNRFALGLIMGGMFVGFSIFIAYFIIIFNRITRRTS